MDNVNGTESMSSSTWMAMRSSLTGITVVVATLLTSWVLYKVFQAVTFSSEIIRESFLFWNIAMSTSQRKLRKPLRLHPYLCETSCLDEIGVNELYHFYKDDFNIGTYSARDLHNFMTTQYTHVLMCRDRMDGTLRGAMLLGIEHKDGYTLVKTGLGTFKNYYRGSPFLNIILISVLMSELLKHPLTPVYLIAKFYSYKAYLFAMSAKECYPVYNRETPEHYKRIFADYAAGVVNAKHERATYKPDTNVIEIEDTCLYENLTLLSEQDLQNPHIKFFVERNPGWRKGHCLVVAARITWIELARQMKLAIMRTIGKRRQAKVPFKTNSAPNETSSNTGTSATSKAPSKKRQLSRPKLLRRYTFQEMSANTYAVNNLEYDLAGEAVLSPNTMNKFAFCVEPEAISPEPTELCVSLGSLI